MYETLGSIPRTTQIHIKGSLINRMLIKNPEPVQMVVQMKVKKIVCKINTDIQIIL